MESWISVDPESASIPQLERINGIELKVFISPHDVPVAVNGAYESEPDRFVIRLKYVDQDSSGTLEERSEDGVVHVFRGLSSRRVERIEVDVRRQYAGEVHLNLMVKAPPSLIEHVRQRLTELRSTQSSVAGRLNYLVVSEAIEQSKAMLAGA